MSNRPPRAVREASKRADDIHAEVYPEDQEPPQGGQEPPQEPVTQEPAPAPSPAEPPAQPPSQAPVEAARPEETIDYWRNKFRTLDGKYRAEVPRQASQIREANARIQNLEQTLAAMSSAPAHQPNGNGKSLVTEEEIAEYGEDFVSMMRRLAQEEAGRAVQQVAPKIEQVRGELQQSRTQTALDGLYGLLDSRVEDWRAINRSPEFLEWLDEEDPFAGETRKSLLRDAFDRKDGNRVLTFFTGFKNQQRAVQPAPQATSPQTPPARTQARVKLEDLAGPRSSGGGGKAPAGDEPTQPWTRRQIAAFYKDVQMGVYKDDPDQKRRIEASIHKASTNGLVTP